jgi:hypothetical protein
VDYFRLADNTGTIASRLESKCRERLISTVNPLCFPAR